MTVLGTRWLRIRRRTLVRFFGLDYIFLYQFGVYLALFIWAVFIVSSRGTIHGWTFLIGTPMVFVGYLIPKKWGVLLCAAGDAAMSYSTGVEAWRMNLVHAPSFGIVITAAIMLCMAARCIRDIVIVASPHAVVLEAE